MKGYYYFAPGKKYTRSGTKKTYTEISVPFVRNENITNVNRIVQYILRFGKFIKYYSIYIQMSF